EQFARGERRDARMRSLRSDKDFISVSREVWQKRNRRIIFRDDPRPRLLFGGDDVLQKHASGLVQVTLARTGLGLDSLEDKIRRVDLAVRMWIRHTDNLAFVLENEH